MKHIITLIIITLCLCCCQHRDNKQEEILSLYKTGKYFEEKDLADSAFIYYSKAFELAKEYKNDSLVGIIGNSLGDILQIQNLYENALQKYREAYRYNKKLKDKTAASILYELSEKIIYVMSTTMILFIKGKWIVHLNILQRLPN